MSEKIRITLSGPSVFPDLNINEGLDANHARDYVEVSRMRYGHINEMRAIKPEEQTLWAMRTLTGLSNADINELYAEDAAEITKTIFGFIEKYFALAKDMWSNAPGESLDKNM